MFSQNKFASIFLSLILIFLLPSEILSQKLIQDSLLLNFETDHSKDIQFSITVDTVFDFRDVAEPRLIGIDEVNHYVFIPVDLHLVTSKPFADVVRDALPGAAPGAKKDLSLGIYHFDISKRGGFLYKRYQINAMVRIYQPSNADSSEPVGELIFESNHTKFFSRAGLKKGYESAFRAWNQELSRDLLTVAQWMENAGAPLPYNFRSYSPNAPWMQLNFGGDFTLISDGFLIDGSLHFAYPEAKRLFFNSSGIIRFRHHKKFDSIAYGLSNNEFNYRLNNKYLFQFRSNISFGLNRWKNMKTVKHELYDALIGDFSISQSVHFHPRYGRTPIFGFGLYQSVYYIYSIGFKFQFGLVFHLGGKI